MCEAEKTKGSVLEMSFREALRAGEQYLNEHGVADASVDAWLLLEFVTGMSRAIFLAEGGQMMETGALARYRALLAQRGSHIPLQHLTGEQEFMGLTFQVNEHVLIPRQDTEILVEETLKRLKPGMHVLDLCTGSGCIAVSLKKLFEMKLRQKRMPVRPEASEREPESDEYAEKKAGLQYREAAAGEVCASALTVEAADISEQALAVARENAARLGADVTFRHSDLFAELSGTYDVIVSNPPYIRSDVIEGLSEEVRCHEPRLALDGSADGLYFYRRIIRESCDYLAEGGWLLFEIGYDQARQVTELLEAAGFEATEVVKDLAGLDRVVLGRRDG